MKYLVIFLMFMGACAKSTEDSMKIMMLMHRPMMEKPYQKTQNPDKDFLENMVPHHEGAILSAEAFLKVGKNKKVLTIASNIIKAQEKEQIEFANIIASMTSTAGYSSEQTTKYHNESSEIMKKMMKEMSDVELTGNVDKDFLMGMIPHHAGAIDESKSVLMFSTNTTVIEIANRIIADQEKEIQEINELLETL